MKEELASEVEEGNELTIEYEPLEEEEEEPEPHCAASLRLHHVSQEASSRRSKRKRKISFKFKEMKTEVIDPSEDEEDLQDVEVKRSRKGSEATSCEDILLRMERSSRCHQARVEKSLQTLTTTLGSIESTMQSTASNIMSFLAGFSQAFKDNSKNSNSSANS